MSTEEQVTSMESQVTSMQSQVTSIEQSQRLLELGVPAQEASMWWERYAGVPENEERFKSAWHLVVNKDAYHYEYVPAFTVADLLGMLPEKMEYRGHLCGCSLKKDRFGYTIEYSDNLSNFSITFATCDTAIDAVVYAVEWIAKNGYTFMNTITLTDACSSGRVYRRLSEAEFM